MPNFAGEHFNMISIYDFDFVAFWIWSAIAVEQMFEYAYCAVCPFLAKRNNCLQQWLGLKLSGYNDIFWT